MMIWVILKVAIRSLWANRLRSVLAMLGIIIGVAAVIFVLALVAGAKRQVMARITALGTNLLVISPGQRGTGGVMSGTQQNLTLDDAMALLQGIPTIRDLTPVVRGSVQVKHLNRNTRSNVLGTAVTYLPIRDYEVEFGRAFSEAETDAAARVAVLGPTTADNLFGGEDRIGKIIKIKGISFRVVGILKAKGDQGFFNPDDQILVPYSTAMRQVLGLDYIQEIDVRAREGEDLSAIQAQATKILRHRHRLLESEANDFFVRNQAEMLRTAGDISQVLALLAGGVAGISLLVGGIGIMNIMLVTVTERTREIGVRKAIGARERDILRQFLIEAVVMSGSGGAIGVAFGVALATILASVTTFQPYVRPESVALALGFAAAVGVFFGYYPARRAAKLDPIEALRYE